MDNTENYIMEITVVTSFQEMRVFWGAIEYMETYFFKTPFLCRFV